MLSLSTVWAPLGLMILGVNGHFGDGHDPHPPHLNGTTIHDPVCTANVTFVDTTTIIESTVLPVTHYVDTTVFHYVNVTVDSTKTNTETTCITESTTTTVHCTVSVTETDSDTITNTQTVTTTDTVPTTVTTYTTTTVLSTKVDPCPTTCSISVGTVDLFFWPPNRPFTYPSTYVDTSLDYTFTSPSVYMLIPTAVGTNSLGTAGPSTSDWILPLDLEEVSTIVSGSITQQLTLNDLGTDCPRSAEPGAIATMVDPRCDPILAAPKQVTSWAQPCNACGRFGLFDPPYAIPTLTGGLVEITTVVPTKTEAPSTEAPSTEAPSTEAPSTETEAPSETPTTSVDASTIDTVVPTTEVVSTPDTPSTSPETEPESEPATEPATEPTTPVVLPSTSPSTSPTVVPTAAASRVTGVLAWLVSSVVVAAILL